MRIKTIVASEIAVLDSDVFTGGGTDDTDALQAALDEALIYGGVRLIMDGAALIRGLKLYSNTTIECLSSDCGFYLADNSNCAVVTNADWDVYSLNTRNITLIGGTYNNNCLHQEHHVPLNADEQTMKMLEVFEGTHWIYGMEFYGVENLIVRDLIIRNQRTFAFMLGGFRHCTVENVWLDLQDRIHGSNQDGFHFWGPGEFLTVKNVGGRVGDDFMNLGPDEHDCKSSITDVVVDGVFLDDAYQAIRLLSRGTGRLDRVTIRNVSGGYHGLGFYINSWFTDETYGDLGNIKFENIDLRPLSTVFIDDPFLFAIGCNVESISFKNIHHHHAQYKHNLFQIGRIGCDVKYNEEHMLEPHIGTLIVDGVYVDDVDQNSADTDYMYLKARVDTLILRDIDVIRSPHIKPCGTFLRICPGAQLGNLLVDRVYVQKLEHFADLSEGKVNRVEISNNLEEGTAGDFIRR